MILKWINKKQEGVEWIDLALEKNKWLGLLNSVKNTLIL